MKRRTARLAAVLGAIGLALGLTLTGTGSAHAATTGTAPVPPAPPAWAEIYNPNLNAQGITLCFDDTNGSTAVGNPAQLYHCHGSDSKGAPQRWEFKPYLQNGQPFIWDGLPTYMLYNEGAKECLTVPFIQGNIPAGTPLVMGACDTAIFELQSVASPNNHTTAFELRRAALFDGFCVAAANASDNNNTLLVTAPCGDPVNSQVLWKLG